MGIREKWNNLQILRRQFIRTPYAAAGAFSDSKREQHMHSRTRYHLGMLLENTANIDAMVAEFLRGNYKYISYFSPLVKEIAETGEKQRIIDAVQNWSKSDPQGMHLYIMCRILFEAGLEAGELTPVLVDGIAKIKDTDSRLMAVSDLYFMTSSNYRLLYDDFYLDKRRIITGICRDYLGEPQDRGRSEHKKEKCMKIAVLTEMFYRANELAINEIIEQFVNELIRQGKEICLFVADLFNEGPHAYALKPIRNMRQNSREYRSYHKGVLDDRCGVFYNTGRDYRSRFQRYVRAIESYDPDLILDISARGAYVNPYLYPNYPIINLSIAGYSTNAVCHKYIGRVRALCLKENERFRALREDQILENVLRPAYVPPQKDFCRKDYGLQETDFVMVTVGRRLEQELDDAFIETICGLLRKHREMKWILVGAFRHERKLHSCQSLLEDGQIVLWGYEADLSGFFGLCDVYVNPDRTGGGNSLTRAADEGVPVALTEFPSDALPIIGLENAVKDYDGIADYVERLFADKSFRASESAKMSARREFGGTEQYIRRLIAQCDELTREFYGKQ